jgi:hypothetical protein
MDRLTGWLDAVQVTATRVRVIAIRDPTLCIEPCHPVRRQPLSRFGGLHEGQFPRAMVGRTRGNALCVKLFYFLLGVG